jgi:hypothetical protein
LRGEHPAPSRLAFLTRDRAVWGLVSMHSSNTPDRFVLVDADNTSELTDVLNSGEPWQITMWNSWRWQAVAAIRQVPGATG